jgi:Fe2+ or Zn2+ uptake regulation protein
MISDAPLADPGNPIRSRGLRVTALRMAVLRAVADAPHATADAVIAAVRAGLGTVSRQGAYDALASLADAGLLRRIEPAGSPARYEVRVDDNHHHLVCRGCGTVMDVDCVVGAAPCLTAPAAAGFVVDEAEVVFWGRCAACRDATVTSAPPRSTASTATIG